MVAIDQAINSKQTHKEKLSDWLIIYSGMYSKHKHP